MPRILLVGLVLILAQRATAAQPARKKPAPVVKIVVVQPQADQQLTGTADVRIQVEVPRGATAPTVMYAGLGGAPWTQVKRGDDTNEMPPFAVRTCPALENRDEELYS